MMYTLPVTAVLFLPQLATSIQIPGGVVARPARHVLPAAQAPGLALQRRSSPPGGVGEGPSRPAASAEPDPSLHPLRPAPSELRDPSVPRTGPRRGDAPAPPPNPPGGRDRWGGVRAELPHGQGGRHGGAPPVARRLAAQLQQREAVRQLQAEREAEHQAWLKKEDAAERGAMQAAEALLTGDQRRTEERKKEKLREKYRKKKEKKKAEAEAGGEGKRGDAIGKEVEEQGARFEGLHLIDTTRRGPKGKI